VTVHREQCVKGQKNQQNATIRCLLSTSVSTCFGQHYAHLQENKGPVTGFGVLFWFSEVQSSHPTTQRLTTATKHIQQNQNSTPNAVNTVFVLLKMGIMMPETC
jgi:hypothetical protein